MVRQCVNDVKTNVSNLNPNMLWDYLKCHIRSKTLGYSARISKKRKVKEENLVSKLNNLEQQFNSNPTDVILNKIKECRVALESIYKVKTDGCMARSRDNWMEYGEKNSKYVINLEKRNQKQKLITKLHSHTGQVLTKGIDILGGEEKYFYQ